MSSFGSSLQLALTATAFALAIGLPFAFLASRSDVPGKRLWQWLLLLPLCLPGRGFVGFWLDWVYRIGDSGIPVFPALPAIQYKFIAAAFELALVYFPLLALPVLWSVIHADRRFAEAAGIYRGSIPVFFRIRLPRVLPYVVTGTLLVFVFCFFDYAVPHVYQLRTLSIEVLLRGGDFQGKLSTMAALMPFAAAAVAATVWSLRQVDCIRSGDGFATDTPPDTGGGRGRSSIVRLTGLQILLAAAVIGPYLLALFTGTASAGSFAAAGLLHRRAAFCVFAVFWAVVLPGLCAADLSEKTRGALRSKGILPGLGVFFLPVAGIALIARAVDLTLMDATFYGLLIGAVGSAAQLLAVCVGYHKPGAFFVGAPLREAALLYQPSRWERCRRILLPLFVKRLMISAGIALVLGMAMFDGRVVPNF